ncbi:DUF1236 domain-containing protein [Pseudolabrys taiwanensis]|uniref:DUF1236 domain-containing protein n=1 Tax=Pseudolabrys taiwanensis TaxID=331696 RepID=A0A345ZZ84_9HYPH|nr:DUF1236 domain-containing protein [Pseudolabrys taiwanensis]AXK82231.1 DUF1236 domain-containing protein [Pseudolabrys taiwanensis]
MRVRFVVTLLAATAMAPAVALAQNNAVGGAVSGAVIGGVVGGPVGAAVGAGVGGTVGAATEPPRGAITYVEREDVPSVEVHERVVVGEPLPGTVELRPIPEYREYRYAVVNHRRVIVEPRTRKIVKIIE